MIKKRTVFTLLLAVLPLVILSTVAFSLFKDHDCVLYDEKYNSYRQNTEMMRINNSEYSLEGDECFQVWLRSPNTSNENSFHFKKEIHIIRGKITSEIDYYHTNLKEDNVLKLTHVFDDGDYENSKFLSASILPFEANTEFQEEFISLDSAMALIK